jgi:hypothetical protein
VYRRFVDAPVDRSQAFTDRVAQLRTELSGRLSASISHDDDMNYNAGQKLGLLLSGGGSPTTDARSATYALSIWISSKGPLWTFLLHRGEEGSLVWRPCRLNELQESPSLRQLPDTIADFLHDRGLSYVNEEVLEELVEGKETEMDGVPATVRDVLFCEIC